MPVLISAFAPALVPLWTVRVPHGVHVMTFDSARDEVVCASFDGYIATFSAGSGSAKRSATTGPNGTGEGINWTVFRLNGRSDDSFTLQTHGGARLNLTTLTLGPSFVNGDSRQILALSPDGGWFSSNGEVRFAGHSSYAYKIPSGAQVALGPYMQHFVTSKWQSKGTDFTAYRGTDGEVAAQFTWPSSNVRNMKFSPDGRYFTFFDNNRFAHILFDGKTFTKVGVIEGMPVELVFSSDAEWAVNVGWEFNFTPKGPSSMLVHVADGKEWPLPHSPNRGNGYDSAAMAAAFAPKLGMFFVSDGYSISAFRFPDRPRNAD